MRFLAGVALALTLQGTAAAETLKVDVPPAVVVPTLEPGTAVAPVSFTRMGANLPDGQVYAAFRTYCGFGASEELRWRSSMNQASDPDFERLFRQEFAKAGLKVSGDQNNLFEPDKKSADLQLGALITDFKATLCQIPYTLKASAVIQVEWQVYASSAGQVVARIPVTAGVRDVKSSNQNTTVGDVVVKILLQSFTENVRGLAANPEFRRIVLAPSLTVAVAPSAPTTSLRAALLTPARPVAIKDAAAGAVVIFAGSSTGSGVLISPDGYILTNHHVAGDSGKVRIRWADGAETVGEVVRADRRRDVALIKVAAPKGRPLAIRRTPVELGETVFAIGTPLDASLQNTVTKGAVSALRMVDGQAFIQSDTPVTYGNSGGPLVDESGAVVGLTDLGLDPAAGSTINFFIPIDDALKVLGVQPAA